MCGQQRNSPMADPIFGSKYGPQNRVQNWITFSFLLLGLCLGPVLGSRFGPKSGVSHRRILLLPAEVLQADLRRTSMSVSVNTCFFSLCVPLCFLYSTASCDSGISLRACTRLLTCCTSNLLYKQLDHRTHVYAMVLGSQRAAERAVFQQHTLLKLRYKNTGESLTFLAGSSNDVHLQLILQHFAPSKPICGGFLFPREQLE